jgi:hypothetical protein
MTPSWQALKSHAYGTDCGAMPGLASLLGSTAAGHHHIGRRRSRIHATRIHAMRPFIHAAVTTRVDAEVAVVWVLGTLLSQSTGSAERSNHSGGHPAPPSMPPPLPGCLTRPDRRATAPAKRADATGDGCTPHRALRRRHVLQEGGFSSYGTAPSVCNSISSTSTSTSAPGMPTAGHQCCWPTLGRLCGDPSQPSRMACASSSGLPWPDGCTPHTAHHVTPLQPATHTSASSPNRLSTRRYPGRAHRLLSRSCCPPTTATASSTP